MIVTQKDQLRNICEKVEPSEGLEVAAKLAFELESNQNGIGLAAPQIGINKRVFVLLKEDGGLLFVINPILLDKKHPYLNEVEGCLSFPNKTVSTIRYREIFWKDEFRKDIFKLEGRDALVFQHECLPHNVLVKTSDGEKTIKEIVETKYSGPVIGYNGKSFIDSKVIGWSSKENRNKKWVSLKFSFSGPNKQLRCTEDHLCGIVKNPLNPKIEYVEAKNSKDLFLVRVPTNQDRNNDLALFSKDQLSVVYGSLLGDMCISKRGEIISNHGEPQKLYSEYKSDLLNGVAKRSFSGFRNEFSNYSSYVSPNCQTKILRELVYPNNQKDVNFLCENIDEIGLAFWYMDDGSLRTHSGVVFHTEGFSYEQNQLLKNTLMNKFNIDSSVSKRSVRDKEKYFISLGRKSEEILFEKIEKYIHYSMLYKLRYSEEFKRYNSILESASRNEENNEILDFLYEKMSKRERAASESRTKISNLRLSFAARKIKEVYYLNNFYSKLYDIKTESGNFVANNSLVHNCDHLDGVLMFDRVEPRKYDDCFCGSKKKYKWCCSEKIHGKKKEVSRRTQ